MKVVEATHGPFLMKAAAMKGRARALAYRRPPTGFRGPLAEAEGATPEAALEALRERLDRREADRRAARREDGRGWAVPTQEEYAEALAHASLSDTQLAMLAAHAEAGDDGMTATEIARAGGYRSYETANVQYGKAGREIGAAIGVNSPRSATREGEEVFTGVLAHGGAPRADSGRFVWIMQPELRAAVLSRPRE